MIHGSLFSGILGPELRCLQCARSYDRSGRPVSQPPLTRLGVREPRHVGVRIG